MPADNSYRFITKLEVTHFPLSHHPLVSLLKASGAEGITSPAEGGAASSTAAQQQTTSAKGTNLPALRTGDHSESPNSGGAGSLCFLLKVQTQSSISCTVDLIYTKTISYTEFIVTSLKRRNIKRTLFLSYYFQNIT